MDDKILQAAQAAAEREAQERQRAEEDEARRGRVAAAWEQVRKLRQNERDTAGGTMRWRDMPERAECWRDLAGSIVNLAAVIEAEGLRQSFEDLCTGYGAMLDTQERLALRYAFDTYRIAFTGDVDAVAKRLFAAISTVGANPVSGCFREHFIWVLLRSIPKEIVADEWPCSTAEQWGLAGADPAIPLTTIGELARDIAPIGDPMDLRGGTIIGPTCAFCGAPVSSEDIRADRPCTSCRVRLSLHIPKNVDELDSWLNELVVGLAGFPDRQILGDGTVTLPIAVPVSCSGPTFAKAALYPPDWLHSIRERLLEILESLLPSDEAADATKALEEARTLRRFRRALLRCRSLLAKSEDVNKVEGRRDKASAAAEPDDKDRDAESHGNAAEVRRTSASLADGRRLDTDAGTRSQGNERKPPSRSTDPHPDAASQNLQPAERKAYWSFEIAELKAGHKLEDREAHNLLKDEGLPEDAGNLGELADYTLPAYETWSRQLRAARKAKGESKYRRRGGRLASRSVVHREDID